MKNYGHNGSQRAVNTIVHKVVALAVQFHKTNAGGTFCTFQSFCSPPG